MESTVELYDIQSDSWSELPGLQQARRNASSCYHKGYIYVFGGVGKYNEPTKETEPESFNSIERLSKTCLRGHAANWELILPDTSSLVPRHSLAMISLNTDEYLILGGKITGG